MTRQPAPLALLGEAPYLPIDTLGERLLTTRPADLLQGTLDLLVLKALTWGPVHGYGVARWIQQLSDDALRVEEGSLYPALHRLEERDLVSSEWGVSENNRRAKFYRLTARGRQHLRGEATAWSRYAEAVQKVLRAVESAG